jgi:hypothetical protein
MVGKSARLTPVFLAALSVAARAAWAQAPAWVVDGNCRDGQPNGLYELHDPAGRLRVAGAFNHGRRTGSFIFWTESGTRAAHIPFDDDVRNGTLATWYPGEPSREPPRRLESAWRQGVRSGLTRSWYADGHRRSETDYAEGRQIASSGWSDTGARLDDTAARALADRDAAEADGYYAGLEAMVRDHLPHCD